MRGRRGLIVRIRINDNADVMMHSQKSDSRKEGFDSKKISGKRCLLFDGKQILNVRKGQEWQEGLEGDVNLVSCIIVTTGT
jgi:hypothetical protein